MKNVQCKKLLRTFPMNSAQFLGKIFFDFATARRKRVFWGFVTVNQSKEVVQTRVACVLFNHQKPLLESVETKVPRLQTLSSINDRKSPAEIINMPKRKQLTDETQAKKAKQTNCGGGGDLKWSTLGAAVKGIPPVVCYDSESLEGRSKVAGFDIDWTVLKTKTGKTFAQGANDWDWLYECVPKKLKELHEDGFRVIFFSNQSGVEKGKAKISDLQKKCETVIKEIGVPVYVYFSTGENQYRKPSDEIWNHFTRNRNGGVKVDLAKSWYIGDAAGRAKGWAPGKSKDFSCSDRMFAANTGVQFKTPEEFFLQEKAAPFEWRSIDPKAVLAAAKKSNSRDYHSNAQEVIVLVGMPASGKSSFFTKHLAPHGYVHINRDTLGAPAKCLKLARESIEDGKSIVVDNTNGSSSARAEFIALAKQHKIGVRCMKMSTERQLAHHLNYVRQTMTQGKVRRIPDVGYNVFFKNYQQPSASEGFSEVISVDFAPDFENDRHKEIFLQWTI